MMQTQRRKLSSHWKFKGLQRSQRLDSYICRCSGINLVDEFDQLVEIYSNVLFLKTYLLKAMGNRQSKKGKKKGKKGKKGKEGEPPPRVVWLNGGEKNKGFPKNKITTSKYTALNFIPKNLFEQFQRIANFYFLCICIVVLVIDSPVSPVTTILPLVIVVLITMVKQGIEDAKRHKNDREVNNRIITVIRDKTELQIKAREVQVGDLVVVRRDEDIPCDIVLLGSSDPDGKAYLTTSNLDGETNLKTMTCPAMLSLFPAEQLATLNARIECEPPNADLYNFYGKIQVFPGDDSGIYGSLMRRGREGRGGQRGGSQGGPRDGEEPAQQLKRSSVAYGEVGEEGRRSLKRVGLVVGEDEQGGAQRGAQEGEEGQEAAARDVRLSRDAGAAGVPVRRFSIGLSAPLDKDNLLLRCTTLRNTEKVYGCAVYTGQETKMSLNSLLTHHKYSVVEKSVNWFLVFFLCFLVVEVIISMVLKYDDEKKNGEGKTTYIGDYYSTSAKAIVVDILSFIILYNYIIPISLYVTMELQKAMGALWFSNDLDMWDEEMQERAMYNTSDINEEMGQVEVLLTDKTGTLTQNDMVFRRCAIGDDVFADEGGQLRELAGDMDAEKGTPVEELTSEMEEFFVALALCNTVQMDTSAQDEPLPPRVPSSSKELKQVEKSRKQEEKKTKKEAKEMKDVEKIRKQEEKKKKKDAKKGGGKETDKEKKGGEEEEKPGIERKEEAGSQAGAEGEIGEEKIEEEDKDKEMEVEDKDKEMEVEDKKDRGEEQEKDKDKDEKKGEEGKGEGKEGKAGKEEKPWRGGGAPPPLEVTKGKSSRYSATSPDEKALVEAAARHGVELVAVQGDSVTLRVKGKERKYRKVDVLEFSSERKRMSVLVEDEAGRTLLLCKGADTAVVPLSGQSSSNVDSQVSDFSKRGLRVMVVASREVSREELLERGLEVEEARQTVSSERARLVERAYERLEQGVRVLGATAVEDGLQPGVRETLEALRAAGIRIWMLTGDNIDTAINVSYSCGHFKAGTEQLHLTHAVDVEGCSQAMMRIMEHVLDDRFRQYALVVDGQSLALALERPMLLRDLSFCCYAVVCCRMSPLQKSEVVAMVKGASQKPITAAIGDGANDVSMILEAHVGFGLMGREGRQAVRSADFAFTRFRYLHKALLVHGHWYYERLATLVLYFFYKNVVFILPQLYYGFYSVFSTEPLFDNIFLMAYNVLFTSSPILTYGLFEQVATARDLYDFPQYYRSVTRNMLLRWPNFFLWMGFGLWHSLVVFFVPVLTVYHSNAVMYLNNQPIDTTGLGTIIYHNVVWVVNLKLLIHSRYWTWLFAGSIGLSVVGYMLVTIVYCIIKFDRHPMYMVYIHLLESPMFWLISFLTIILCLIPDLTYIVVINYIPQKTTPSRVKPTCYCWDDDPEKKGCLACHDILVEASGEQKEDYPDKVV